MCIKDKKRVYDFECPSTLKYFKTNNYLGATKFEPTIQFAYTINILSYYDVLWKQINMNIMQILWSNRLGWWIQYWLVWSNCLVQFVSVNVIFWYVAVTFSTILLVLKKDLR